MFVQEKSQKTLREWGNHPTPPAPHALIRPRVKLEFSATNFSLRTQPSLLRILVLRTDRQEFATENGKRLKLRAARKTALLAD